MNAHLFNSLGLVQAICDFRSQFDQLNIIFYSSTFHTFVGGCVLNEKYKFSWRNGINLFLIEEMEPIDFKLKNGTNWFQVEKRNQLISNWRNGTFWF